LPKIFFSRDISASGGSVAGVFGRPLFICELAEPGRKVEDPALAGDPFSSASNTVGKWSFA
jgi:hypothetical protein